MPVYVSVYSCMLSYPQNRNQMDTHTLIGELSATDFGAGELSASAYGAGDLSASTCGAGVLSVTPIGAVEK